MSFRRRLKNKKPPAGWDLIESSIEDFEQQMRDAVGEEHEGKRKNELTWRIHRIHWEKNRFIFDLRYKKNVLSDELYNYLCREKVADQPLISKWRKPGYENLCSLLSIQKGDTNFGTASICRVPMASRAPQQQARSIHWFPYDRVRVVNADPQGLYLPAHLSAHPSPLSIPTHLDAFQLRF